MKPPRSSLPYPDRHLECQEAIEARIVAVIDEGRGAGWSVSEIAAALIDLADNLMLADAANAETAQRIKEAVARIRHG